MKLKNYGIGLGRKTLALFVIVLVGLCDPGISTSEAGHFGFKGGFRGGFGRNSFKRNSFKRNSFKRSFSRKGFNRVGKFRSFGFRGFNNFGRSKFNSLAFRSRRFGSNRFNSFGRSNRFSSFNRFNSFRGFRSPRFNSFAFSNFPSQRFHTGFASFQPTRFVAAKPTVIVSPCGSTYSVAKPVNPYVVSRPAFTPTIASSQGWELLANSKAGDASVAFADNISSNVKPGESRVGFAMSAAAMGNLDLGVKAMKRAFALNSGEIGSLMFEDKLLPMVEELTRKYETRMETGSSKNDDAYMLAALYQMQGDPEMASMAFDYVSNETSPTSSNLGTLIKTEMASIPMTHGEGWDLLAEGRSREAISSFVKNIGTDSGSGIAKLGYGLSYAEIGDFEQAAWAIERAFEIDPENVSDIMLDGKLRPTLQKIADKFEITEPMPLDKDKSLVLATIHQLLGDIEMAQLVADKGQHDSSMYLISMIKDESKMEKEMAEEAIPTLEKMDESELVALNPPLLPIIVPESSPENAPDFIGPQLPPDFDAIENLPSLDSAKDKLPLVLIGSGGAKQ